MSLPIPDLPRGAILGKRRLELIDVHPNTVEPRPVGALSIRLPGPVAAPSDVASDLPTLNFSTIRGPAPTSGAATAFWDAAAAAVPSSRVAVAATPASSPTAVQSTATASSCTAVQPAADLDVSASLAAILSGLPALPRVRTSSSRLSADFRGSLQAGSISTLCSSRVPKLLVPANFSRCSFLALGARDHPWCGRLRGATGSASPPPSTSERRQRPGREFLGSREGGCCTGGRAGSRGRAIPTRRRRCRSSEAPSSATERTRPPGPSLPTSFADC
mmetsp:Transcript_10669/g.23526  ORF Transcript_10669/g.23526 Transcript_10669/m.23526 type:complete len:275 (+) Transcript_10669:738-1562(+)